LLKGYYKDGKENGLWENFNIDGTLQKTDIYKDGWVVE
jgi:antitoxin component YwqK of YwqJK toxin-antitoxin module